MPLVMMALGRLTGEANQSNQIQHNTINGDSKCMYHLKNSEMHSDEQLEIDDRSICMSSWWTLVDFNELGTAHTGRAGAGERSRGNRKGGAGGIGRGVGCGCGEGDWGRAVGEESAVVEPRCDSAATVFSATGDIEDTGGSGARRVRIQVHCISIPLLLILSFIANYKRLLKLKAKVLCGY
jgi:hypothetical protein